MVVTEKRLGLVGHRNLRWLLLCILSAGLSLLVWSRLSSEDVELFVPIDLGDIPEGLAIANALPKGIEIRARGPKHLVGKLDEHQLRYTVELGDVGIGDNFVRVEKSRIPIPGRFSIDKVNPPVLAVTIEREIRKELPIMVSVSGTPAPGFLVADAVARPPSVILRGPEGALTPIEEAVTKAIDVRGLSESLKKEIVLDLPRGLLVDSPAGTILAEVFIEEERIVKEFEGVPVEGLDSHRAHSIVPPTISIRVKGPVSLLQRLDTQSGIRAYVNLKQLGPGVYARPAVITLPLQTVLVSVDPEVFTVTVN